jgi:hypothetical protein
LCATVLAVRLKAPQKAKNPPGKRALTKRLMGLEPTTFCMAIVCESRMNAH